jgi:hypothetical protein
MKDKRLSFRQDAMIENYLFILEEFIRDKDNAEIREALKEASDKLETFLTLEEIASLDAEVSLPTQEQPVEIVELGQVALPRGWKADSMTITEPEYKVDMEKRVIYLTQMIYPTPPQQL